MSATVKQFTELDRKLAWKSFPKLGTWWIREASRFLSNATARTWAVRVGRGGAKSTVLARLALAETLFGKWTIGKGERHFFVLVSVSKDEAAQRLTLLESYLRALGVPFVRAGDTIELKNLPRGLKVLAAQIPAVAGFRCFGFGCDEVAKWRSADDGANPAKEVAASLRAMTVTHPGARAVFVSSPLARSDYHSCLVDAGDTATQVVSQAPTWVANPSVTEEQTHALEPDRRVWKREYLAVPQAGALSAFDEADIERAFRPRDDIDRFRERVLVVDLSSGKKDNLTAGVAAWAETETRESVFVLDEIWGFTAAEVREAGIDAVVATIARRAKRAGVSRAFGDQRESMMLESALGQHGLDFTELAWTAANKPRGVARLRRWLLEGRIALPPHEALKRELLNFEERITDGGQFTFGARGSGHDDFVALLITAALADEGRMLAGSPDASTPAPVLRMISELNNRASNRRGRGLTGDSGDSHHWLNRHDPTLPGDASGNDTRDGALGRSLGRRGGSNGWGGF